MTGLKAPAGDGGSAAGVGELSYTEASRELDEIVAFFEQREVDVDQLVARLARATAIVDELDQRLRRTRAQVEELVPRLEAAAGSHDQQAQALVGEELKEEMLSGGGAGGEAPAAEGEDADGDTPESSPGLF